MMVMVVLVVVMEMWNKAKMSLEKLTVLILALPVDESFYFTLFFLIINDIVSYLMERWDMYI